MNTFCIHITASVKMCEKRKRFRFVYAFLQQSIRNMYIALTAMFDVVSHSPLNYVQTYIAYGQLLLICLNISALFTFLRGHFISNNIKLNIALCICLVICFSLFSIYQHDLMHHVTPQAIDHNHMQFNAIYSTLVMCTNVFIYPINFCLFRNTMLYRRGWGLMLVFVVGRNGNINVMLCR